MVKLISIISSALVIFAFFVVTFVFIDRFFLEREALFETNEDAAVAAIQSQSTPARLSAASEKFEMIKPVETSSSLLREENSSSVIRFLSSLEDERRATKVDINTAGGQVPNDLTIVLTENLSEVFLKGIGKDLIDRGFNDIVIQQSADQIFFQGFKDEGEQKDISDILSFSFFLEPILLASYQR